MTKRCFIYVHFNGHQAGVHTSPVRGLRYGWWSYMLGERTTPRLKQYSKIISVDGNLASGKGALAQKLADKLGNCLTAGIHHVILRQYPFISNNLIVGDNISQPIQAVEITALKQTLTFGENMPFVFMGVRIELLQLDYCRACKQSRCLSC